MFIASQNGFTDVVGHLCFHGAHAGIALTDGTTPFFVAAQNGHLEVCKILVSQAVDIDARRHDGATALCGVPEATPPDHPVPL